MATQTVQRHDRVRFLNTGLTHVVADISNRGPLSFCGILFRWDDSWSSTPEPRGCTRCEVIRIEIEGTGE